MTRAAEYVELPPGMPLMLDPRHRHIHIEPFPWDLMQRHRLQAERNHGQTIERLRERGGLSPSELAAILRGEGIESALLIPEIKALQEIAKYIAEASP